MGGPLWLPEAWGWESMKGIYQLLLFVILSAAKDLGSRHVRSFAALRMTTDDRFRLLKFIIGPPWVF